MGWDTRYGTLSTGYSVSEKYMMKWDDLSKEGRSSVGIPHRPATAAHRMNDTTTVQPNWPGVLVATAPGARSVGENEGEDSAPIEYRADGGESPVTLSEGGPEQVLNRVVEIHDLLLDLEYGPHIVVLLAVAVLNECGERETVKTGIIRKVANRMTTHTREPHTIEYSLETLFRHGCLDRTNAKVGNAYHWEITPKGETLIQLYREVGVVDKLTESSITADV